MLTIQNYVTVESLEEAYALNQSRGNLVLGGGCWLRLGNRRIQTAIDLSGLGLDSIAEDEQRFSIGCMCTLRQLETHPQLNARFSNIFRDCLESVVGVQLRNCATVGGAVFGRYGFSDLLTCLLALDTHVELHAAGCVPLEAFLAMPADNDILVCIHIGKDGRAARYRAHRRAATDLPMVTCAVSRSGSLWLAAVGARPSRAALYREDAPKMGTGEDAAAFARRACDALAFAGNMRAGAAYRRHLAELSIRQCITEIREGQ